MDTTGIFGGTIPILEKTLDLRSRRHEVLTANIVNADTPNFKAFDLMVEEAMKKAGPAGPGVSLEKTSPGHLEGRGRIESAGPAARPLPQEDPEKADGNTVDLDREMMSLSANHLLYNAEAMILGKKFNGLKTAIKGGK